MGSSLNENLNTLFDKAEELISTKTVVGDSITLGDVTIVPLIEVSIGVAAGGSQTPEKGAGGMGAKIVPSAVLAIHNGNVQLVNIKNQTAVNKLLDMAPGIADRLNFGAIFKKDSQEGKQETNINFNEETFTEKDIKNSAKNESDNKGEQ